MSVGSFGIFNFGVEGEYAEAEYVLSFGFALPNNPVTPPTSPCKSCWILICSCQKIKGYENDAAEIFYFISKKYKTNKNRILTGGLVPEG